MKGFIEITEAISQFEEKKYVKYLISIDSIKLIRQSDIPFDDANTEVVVKHPHSDMFGHIFEETSFHVVEEYEQLVNEIKKYQSQ